MKQCYFLLILLLAGGLFSACKKSNIEYANDFEKSYQEWNHFKVESNNSYRYVVANGSWNGTKMVTTLTVQAGQVTHRSFIYTMQDPTSGIITTVEEWEEDAATLNTHTQGFDAITLDEVYRIAKTDWLKKREDSRTYFEAKNNGLLSNCGYVPHGCADDCFTGVTIISIEKL